jgi:hypothetical protein
MSPKIWYYSHASKNAKVKAVWTCKAVATHIIFKLEFWNAVQQQLQVSVLPQKQSHSTSGNDVIKRHGMQFTLYMDFSIVNTHINQEKKRVCTTKTRDHRQIRTASQSDRQ